MQGCLQPQSIPSANAPTKSDMLAGSTLNVSRLIAAGCGVDLTTNDGWTALHEAAANGHLPVVQILLDADSQVSHLATISFHLPL